MADSEQNTTLQADVVIVGGGLAGLTAAVGLRQSGLRIIVVERDKILGGRSRSWVDEKTGDTISVGPHIFLTEYPNMMKLLRILGTEHKIVWQRGSFITIADGQRETTIRWMGLPPPFHLLGSIIWNREYFPLLDVITNLPVIWYAMTLDEQEVLELDEHNALSFLRAFGVREGFMQRFWAFASNSIMNVPLNLCSAGALLRFYSRMVSYMHYDVGFADGGLGDLFAPQARELIEDSGGLVLLKTAVRRFTGDGYRATGVELSDGRRIDARYCISALPPNALRRVARRDWIDSHTPFRDLVHFHPSPYISTYLWFDRKLTDKQFWARSYNPNDLNCDFYDYANIYSRRNSDCSLICTNCIFCERAQSMTDSEIIETTVRELAEYLPEAAQAGVKHAYVSRIPMAIHCPFPGTERLRPKTRTSVQNLFLAGDWVQTALPTSMESACRAGWLAAEAVCEAIGQRRTLAVDHKPPEGFAYLFNRGAAVTRKLLLRR